MKPIRLDVGNGLQLYCITTDKFKSEYLSMQFYLPLLAETAQENALLSVVLRRGTKRFPDKQRLNRHLDDLYSTAIGIRNRRLGDMQNIGFTADFLGERYIGGERLLLEVIDTLREILFEPSLDQGLLRREFVESEKNNLRDAIRAAVNDPRAYAIAGCRKLLCAGEPFALSLIGDETTVDAISAASLTQRYQAFLKQAVPVFFYVGNTPPEHVAELLRAAFSPLSGKLPSLDARVAAPSGKIARREEEMPLCQGKLSIGFRTDISLSHRLAPALLLLNEIYGGSAASKLFLNVREKRSLCYHCSSSLDLYKGVILANSGMKPENRQITEEAMLEEFYALQRGNITAGELEAARRSLDHSYAHLFDHPGALCDFYLGRVLAGNPDTVSEWRQKVAAVRLDEIVEVAQSLGVGAAFFLKGTLEEDDE